jgi:hypothetical protein
MPLTFGGVATSPDAADRTPPATKENATGIIEAPAARYLHSTSTSSQRPRRSRAREARACISIQTGAR